MPDEKQRIIMEVVNAEKIRDLTGQLDKQTASLESLAKQLHDTTLTQGMFDAAAKPFAEKAASLRKEIKQLEAETKSYGQAALTAAHATQDLVQGGIGGVLNNIPMLVQQLGGPAGLTAIISGVGIAAYVATPHIKAWWKSLAGGEAVGGLVGLSKALEAIKGEIDKIKEADIWNLETIQRYNEKLADQAQIEKDIAERKQHKNDYEAFMASQAPEDKARSEELRKGFAEVFAGQGKELQAELIKGMDAQAEIVRDQLRREMAGVETLMKQAANRGDNASARKHGERIKAIDKQIAEIGSDINRRAIDLIAEASAGTDRTKQKRAIDEMRGLVGDATRTGLDMVVERDWGDHPEVETDAERDKRVLAKRKADADKKARRARQDEEIAQAAQTPEDEAKVVEAFNYIKRNFPKLKANERELVGIAEDARKNFDANPNLTAAQASRLAVNNFQGGRDKLADAAQLDAIRGQIDAGTGGAWNQDQVAEAAKRTQDLVKQGFDAQWAMGAVVRAMQQENAELAGQVAELNGFIGQLQQGQQTTRGRLRRNRR